MPKTRNDEIYEHGVREGLKGDWVSDNLEDLTPWWLSPYLDEKELEIYKKGYEWGARHRYEYREKQKEEQEKKEEAQAKQKKEARESVSEGGGGGGGVGLPLPLELFPSAILYLLVTVGFIILLVFIANRFKYYHESMDDKINQWLASHSLAETENIYSFDIASKEEREFTFGTQPHFSPNGKKVAFLRKAFAEGKNYLLCFDDSNGTNIEYTDRRIKKNDNFCWTSDSNFIVSIYNGLFGESFLSLDPIPSSGYQDNTNCGVSGRILSLGSR